MTLLSMGRKGFASLLRERKELVGYFRERLSQVASKYQERLLHCPANTISFGMSLSSIVTDIDPKEKAQVSRVPSLTLILRALWLMMYMVDHTGSIVLRIYVVSSLYFGHKGSSSAPD